MVSGRRSIGIHEPDAWIFNRMATAYAARPPYPPEVVDAIAATLPSPGGRVGDLGAGTGHLALPLAERGLDVHAFEPALSMLEALRSEAARRGLALPCVHAAAEALPVADASLALAVIADALHFIDAELACAELARVLTRRAGLAVLTVEPAETPFMRGVVSAMEEAAPRRPRNVGQAVVQLFASLQIPAREARVVSDETPVDEARLIEILRSISFIGPAMNAARFAAFRERVLAVPGPRVWARTLTVHTGQRPR